MENKNDLAKYSSADLAQSKAKKETFEMDLKRLCELLWGFGLNQNEIARALTAEIDFVLAAIPCELCDLNPNPRNEFASNDLLYKHGFNDAVSIDFLRYKEREALCEYRTLESTALADLKAMIAYYRNLPFGENASLDSFRAELLTRAISISRGGIKSALKTLENTKDFTAEVKTKNGGALIIKPPVIIDVLNNGKVREMNFKGEVLREYDSKDFKAKEAK